MPIDATCPGCQKQYKLKDELAGKTVKCSNPDCRKPFPVPGGANGKPAAKPKPKSKKEAEAEAEALAAQLFGEAAEDAKPVVERTITVECVMCNFKWPEPESKAGKNVICPECKHRMKVPDPKAKKQVDWRDSSGGRRGGEKGPELPKDLADQEMREVSIGALVSAKAIEEPEVEPRPVGFWITLAAVILVVVGGTAGAILWVVKSGQTGQENTAMAEALKDLEGLKDDGSPIGKDDRRLMRTNLLIASGEYHARLDTKEGIKEAVKAFAAARRELEGAPKSMYERDALFAELAVAQVSLGGTEAQAEGETKLRWSTQDFKKGPPVGNTVIDYVQTELRQTLAKFVERDVDKGVRLMAVARITRELCKQGHADILFEIVSQGFAPDDAAEAQAFALLVASRNGGPEDRIKTQVQTLATQLKTDPNMPLAWPLIALFDKFGITDVETKSKIPPPVADSGVGAQSRLAYSALYLNQDKVPEAVKLASSPPGTAAERFPAMAILAELMADPKPLLEEAAKAKDAQPGNRFHLYRLTRAAADAGAGDKAEQFAKAITDEGLREWATAEAGRAKWAASKSVAPSGDLTSPSEVSKTKAGQAWAALLFARHNAKTTGDRGAGKQYDEWADKKLRGFGYAGMALGLQDGK